MKTSRFDRVMPTGTTELLRKGSFYVTVTRTRIPNGRGECAKYYSVKKGGQELASHKEAAAAFDDMEARHIKNDNPTKH